MAAENHTKTKAIPRLKYLVSIVLTLFISAVQADQPAAGDEIAGEAFVTWKAVIDKVRNTQGDGYRVKAKLFFQGRTSEGNQIRGTGKLRFIGEPGAVFSIGDPVRGSDSLRYWATVRNMMGEDLAMIQGMGILNFAMTDSVLTTEGAVEFKAAMEIYDGDQQHR